MIKTIGIIGAGNIGLTVAKHLLKAGYKVKLSNSKGPESLSDTVQELGDGAVAATAKDAANSDIVLVSIPWQQIDTLTALTNWEGKTVIDATNAFVTFAPDFKVADLGGKPSTSVMASKVPGANVVKAFNTIYFKVLALDPKEGNGRRVLFLSGNHAGAKNEVKEVIDRIGFAPIDLGTLDGGSKFQEPGGALANINLAKFG